MRRVWCKLIFREYTRHVVSDIGVVMKLSMLIRAYLSQTFTSRDSSVSIVNRLRTGVFGVRFPAVAVDFLFSKTSRLALGPAHASKDGPCEHLSDGPCIHLSDARVRRILHHDTHSSLYIKYSYLYMFRP